MPPVVCFRPSEAEIEASAMTAFARFCEERTGHRLKDHAALHAFACTERETFWKLLLAWSQVPYDGSPEPAIERPDDAETAAFFPNLRLSYAEALLLGGRGRRGAPAVTALDEHGVTARLTFGELEERAGALAAELSEMGVRRGDRVAAVVRNQAEAIVAALGTASLGASWSAVAPDFTVDATLQRFGPLAPSVLVVNTSFRLQGSRRSIRDNLAACARSLPSLRGILALDGEEELDLGGADVPIVRSCLVSGAGRPPLRPVRVPFDHPLYILFSSGTTGPPKCLVHGHGGTLLEHFKELRMHTGLGPGCKLYYHTSCAWMMWNWMVSALMTGAELVAYDGSASWPAQDAAFRIAAEHGVTHFGTSASYLQQCRDAGIAIPALPDLRCVLSTGSVLYESEFDWLSSQLPGVPVHSISGGTDIVGCFVLGSPNLPVYRGESPCISLGYDVRVITPEGLRRQGAGELVCVGPFPSRPAGLFGDPEGRRFHEAYFAERQGVWTHGDFVELTDRGTARILGRSDGVMNVMGIRIGPAEIYNVLKDVPEVTQALAVTQQDPWEVGGSRLVLLVVLKEGLRLERALVQQVKKRIRRLTSVAHVPRVIAQCTALPTTFSGKLSERAATDVLWGREVRNRSALRNPETLDEIRTHPDLQVAES